MNKKKVRLTLNGLHCANCANKIENQCNKLNGVEARLNFASKEMNVLYEDEIGEEIVNKIKKIVHSLEPDVEVLDNLQNMETIKFNIEGLHCGGCAVKIENALNNLNNIEAQLNFPSKTLTIKFRGDRVKTIELVECTIAKIEDGVLLKEQNNEDINESIEKKIIKHSIIDELKTPKFYRLAVGIILFIGAMLYKTVDSIASPLFLISYLLIGGDVVLKAGKNILKGRVFDENFLMTIATIGAFLIGEHPEAVAVMLFYKIGEALQEMAVNKSRKSIASLMDIRPEYANLLIDGVDKKVSPYNVRVGDIIIVKPGEKVPLDGVVVEGESTLDTVALTGESVPREATVGDEVLSGFINKVGLLHLKVTKEFKESTVSKILELVEESTSKKAKAENFITKFANYYTPVVVIIALLLAFLPPLILSEDFSKWIYRGLIFLVVSCPCALVISIPLSYFGGIGAASRRGILIKGSSYLDILKNIDTIVFDKTGTLTKGIFKVTNIFTFNDYTEGDLLKLAAYAESISNHPIAKSIVEKYGETINKKEIQNSMEIPGRGIEAIISGKKVLAGNMKLMNENNIKTPEGIDAIGTVVYVGVDGVFRGYIIISDEIKNDTDRALIEIKRLGIKDTIMLTGDNKKAAMNIAKSIEIDKIYSDLLPQDKVKIFEEITENKKAAFVGDGINDAPCLARADVGIAMGGLGSDAAIEASDVVIMTDELLKIPEAIKISKLTSKVVIQNIFLALSIKAIVLVLGSMGLANMWEAVFADVGVTILAVINSMRILKYK